MVPLASVFEIDRRRLVFERLRALIESGQAIAFSSAGELVGIYPL